MSLLLRHQPEKIGLALDEHGWASVADLIALTQNGSVRLSRELIAEVVATNDKKRFVLSEDGERIRAAQGHSIEVDLALMPREPPEYLYHGTATRFVESIRASGILRGKRHDVHLSADEETAVKVGQRHGKPVVITIRAGDMWRAGIPFTCSENGVWLTDEVPTAYLLFPEDLVSGFI
jgi:putative RNA 2'-phosphotransferase